MAKIFFELILKDGNISPEKVGKSRQMQLRNKTAYVGIFAIEEIPSLVPALYATLVCTNSRLFAPSMSPRAIASLSRNISCLEIPDDQGMPNYELVF